MAASAAPEQIMLPADETCTHASGIFRLTGSPTAMDVVQAVVAGGDSYVCGTLRLQMMSEKMRTKTQEVFALEQARNQDVARFPLIPMVPFAMGEYTMASPQVPVSTAPPPLTPTAPPPTPTAPLLGEASQWTYYNQQHPPAAYFGQSPAAPPPTGYPAPAPYGATTPSPYAPVAYAAGAYYAPQPQAPPAQVQKPPEWEPPPPAYSMPGQQASMTNWGADNSSVVMFTVRFSVESLTKLATSIDSRVSDSKDKSVNAGFSFAQCVNRLVAAARKKIAEQAYAFMDALKCANAENPDDVITFSGTDPIRVSPEVSFAVAENSGEAVKSMSMQNAPSGPKLLQSGGAFTIFACNICAPMHGGACVYRKLILILQDVGMEGLTTILPMPMPNMETSETAKAANRVTVRLEYKAAKPRSKKPTGSMQGSPMHKWGELTMCEQCLLVEAMLKAANTPGKPTRHSHAMKATPTRVQYAYMM